MVLPAVLSAVLAACAASPDDHEFGSPYDGDLSEALDMIADTDLSEPHVRQALEAIWEGDYATAQAGFNQALKFNPRSSHLHFLNGLTYHLRAERGDSSQLTFAAIGYRLALKYDPANYWAAYQLGHIHYFEQKYKQAQEAFAYALLLSPEEPRLMKALIVASYYAQDLETAYELSRTTEPTLDHDPGFLRSAAIIYAASGNPLSAQDKLVKYRSVSGHGRQTAHLSNRVNDWERVHTRESLLQLAQSLDSTTVLGLDGTSEGVSASDTSTDGGGSMTDTMSADDASSSDDEDAAKGSSKRMAMVDVVIIRSEERKTSRKGVNLLNGLSATLGGTSFTFNSVRTVNDPGTGPNSLVHTFTYNPTLSLSATYSLNIFNDNNDRNEVLAQPSLLALENEKSEFYAGSVFHVELDGASGSEGSVEEVPVGIRLEVTPKFIDDETVELDVNATRAFVEARSSLIGFSNFAQVTKTLVTANVVMKFGETVIISGLSEKETENLRDGTPFLQDVPVIQYLFSREDDLDTTKSILVLLTPRKTQYMNDNGQMESAATPASADSSVQKNLQVLKRRLNPLPKRSTTTAVLSHLESSRMYQEFRAGDLKLEDWDDEYGLRERIIRAVEFLYF